MTRPTLMALVLTGCYPDLSDTLDPGPPLPEGTGDEMVLDATDYDLWVGLDLDTLTIIDDGFTDDSDGDWDLAARRFEIKVNGGVSGEGGVEVAQMTDPPSIPTDGWGTDEADADDDGVPEYVLLAWYEYDYDTHELSPQEHTYALRTTEGSVFEIAFRSYYDANGTPARIHLTAVPLD